MLEKKLSVQLFIRFNTGKNAEVVGKGYCIHFKFVKIHLTQNHPRLTSKRHGIKLYQMTLCYKNGLTIFGLK
jgi:hypothetical protein